MEAFNGHSLAFVTIQILRTYMQNQELFKGSNAINIKEGSNRNTCKGISGVKINMKWVLRIDKFVQVASTSTVSVHLVLLYFVDPKYRIPHARL